MAAACDPACEHGRCVVVAPATNASAALSGCVCDDHWRDASCSVRAASSQAALSAVMMTLLPLSVGMAAVMWLNCKQGKRDPSYRFSVHNRSELLPASRVERLAITMLVLEYAQIMSAQFTQF